MILALVIGTAIWLAGSYVALAKYDEHRIGRMRYALASGASLAVGLALVGGASALGAYSIGPALTDLRRRDR